MYSKFEPNLIIGLGNPGDKYKNTYHNVGHIFLNYLKNKTGNRWETAKNKNFEYIKGGGVSLVKTLSFVNESGKSVSSAVKFFSSKPDQILVTHDDSDLVIGKYKLSKGGSSAGHKGIDSVIKHLKTKDFWRFRIGIRPEKEKSRSKAAEFVLKKIKKRDLEKIYSAFDEIMEKLMVKVFP